MSCSTTGACTFNPRQLFGYSTVSGSITYDGNAAGFAASEPTFCAAVGAWTAGIISELATEAVKPQAIIVWDIEGQEFVQPLTYVGHPAQVASFAPEMTTTIASCSGYAQWSNQTAANYIFTQFTNAGYKVGVTLRGSTVGTNASTPGSCNYSATYAATDKFVNTAATYPNRGFTCGSGSTYGSSSGVGSCPTGSSGPLPCQQTTQVTENDTALAATYEADIAYAFNNWGATVFYMDSTLTSGGTPWGATIYQTLQTYCGTLSGSPTCLFIPEQRTSPDNATPSSYAYASAYLSSPAVGTHSATRANYPSAFSNVSIENSFTGTPCGPNTVIAGVTSNGGWGAWQGNGGYPGSGDIMMIVGGQNSTAHLCGGKIYIGNHWF